LCFQAEDGIRDFHVTGVQTCALPIWAGLVISEMIASQAMVRETRRTMKMIETCDEERPVAVQLAGHEPKVMAEAARLNEGRGVEIGRAACRGRVGGGAGGGRLTERAQ